LRELHWHQNADEWQYYISGKGRMTVVATGNRARTLDFQAGDVGYVEKLCCITSRIPGTPT
jgi:oxalate decarboxylase